MDYNLMSQYVQSEKPLPKMAQQKPQQPQIPQEVLSQMVGNDTDGFMTEEDKALIMGVTGELTGSQVSIQQPANIHPKPVVLQGQGESEDAMLVRRILKRSTTPDVDCKVNWKNFPTKQMEMLDMMAVDVDTIVDYYIKDIDLEQIREIVKEGIRKHIEKSLCIEEQLEEKPIKEQTSSKPNNNKTKEKKKK
jgi:hypothetical protein